ncbi:MAG: NAD-binding protein, partial [Mycobacterium sp.]|nr:NAD-binding protein [Mycobacterium sp.]
MHHHVIVSGEDSLATTIIQELENAGATVVKLANTELTEAEVTRAAAVVCAGNDDATNLEIALLARKANPDLAVVARLTNDVLREAVTADNGPGAILNVADLAAPSVVEACLAHTTHPFEVAGIKFVVSGSEAPRDATLREIYDDLAPVAVIHRENGSVPDEVVACPGRDLRVHQGDWTVMIGTADELASRGIKPPRPIATRASQPRLRRALDAARTLRSDVNPAFYPLMAAALTLLIVSTTVLRFS